MRTQDVFAYFGTKAALSRAIGYSTAAFYKWGEFPPEMVQFKIEAITNGELKRTPGTGQRREWARREKE